MNVLITNIGRRGYLVDFLRNTSNFIGNIYVSDCDYTASGLYSKCDEYFILPRPTNDEGLYVKKLMNICLLKKIKIIIPVIDPEIYILSKYKEKFRKKGILIIVSSRDVLEICYNKLFMNEFLLKNNFNVIKTFNNIKTFQTALEKEQINFPVFIKPIYGSGSTNSFKVDDFKKLKALFCDGMIIQEYIEGTEYGVDIFNNLQHTPVRIVIKEKISMRSGETDKSRTIFNKNIFDVTKKLAEILKHFGPLDCDVIETKKNIYVLDINPRLGGGYPATHEAGINFLELIVKLYKNEKITPQFNNYLLDRIIVKGISIKSISVNKEEKYEFN
ncbi:ATP-grasp domain-containing protein [Haloimpatiens sp. FM7330]|uniref:ATP-grasp domain-containing protein n=1 Tax=Haloimpatiens sp. FM7330 TaxID=3298610 RepID=UPI003630CBCD